MVYPIVFEPLIWALCLVMQHSNCSGAKVNCNNYPLRTGSNFDEFHSDHFGSHAYMHG